MRIDLLLKFSCICKYLSFWYIPPAYILSLLSHGIVIVNWVDNNNRFSLLAELFNRFVPNQAYL